MERRPLTQLQCARLCAPCDYGCRRAYMVRNAQDLRALYVLMHRFIRVAEDIERAGKGVYSPTLRDNAQEARALGRAEAGGRDHLFDLDGRRPLAARPSAAVTLAYKPIAIGAPPTRSVPAERAEPKVSVEGPLRGRGWSSAVLQGMSQKAGSGHRLVDVDWPRWG